MGSVLTGKILLQQFRVDQHIASTSMSDVYKVWDLHRNVPLAMKVLNADLAEDPAMLKRFKREAQALKNLRHPHIVPFYGLLETEEKYFLLEAFIDGPSLKDILEQLPGHKMGIDEALIYLKSISAALGYAHANGVVHCDIKPGNVMVDQGGTIYLTDFGIARHADSSTTTMAGAGTAAYMAPEQIKEEVVTPTADVYALGIVLYEMLTGRRPFRGDDAEVGSLGRSTNERLRHAHLAVHPPDPRRFRPDLPKELAEVILKALNKKPEERQASAPAFFTDVCAAVGVAERDVRDRIHSLFGPKLQGTNSEPANGTVSKPKRQKHIPVWVWVGGLAIFVSVTILLVMNLPGLGAGLDAETDVSEVEPSPIIEPSPETTSQVTQHIAPSPTAITEAFATPIQPPASATASPSLSPEPETATTTLIVESAAAFNDYADLVLIPKGEFVMGLAPEQIFILCNLSPKCNLERLSYSAPDHRVFLGDYAIYRTEVTNAQYALCVDAGFCTPPHDDSQYKVDSYFRNPANDSYPVFHVDWYQADQYCKAAGGRLPTEAEWEKAARGNDGRLWPWGNETPQDYHANLSDTNMSTIDGTTAVGRFNPAGDSPYGLADMAGNVFEWGADWYSYTYFGESPYENPQGPIESNRYDQGGPVKVVKGGSSGYESWAAAAGLHDFFEASSEGHAVGFRCVRPAP